MTHTPRTRALLAATAAVLALSLSACGGDDSDGGSGGSGGSGDSGGPDGTEAGSGVSDGNGGEVPAMQGEDCPAEVTLTGAVEDEWSEDGKVDVSSSDLAPPATYQSIHDGTMLTVASTGNGFDDPSVILLADGKSYGVTFGEGDVDVEDDGSGATVDAPAGGIGTEGTVQVMATFRC